MSFHRPPDLSPRRFGSFLTRSPPLVRRSAATSRVTPCSDLPAGHPDELANRAPVPDHRRRPELHIERCVVQIRLRRWAGASRFPTHASESCRRASVRNPAPRGRNQGDCRQFKRKESESQYLAGFGRHAPVTLMPRALSWWRLVRVRHARKRGGFSSAFCAVVMKTRREGRGTWRRDTRSSGFRSSSPRRR